MCDEIKVSYITINYNSSNYTIELIKSIEEHSSLEYEIIVVDNKSDENDFINLKRNVQNKPKVKLIRNTSNDGFSAGNMIGTKYAKAEYFFFINNDTRLLNDASSIMANYLDLNENISLATGKISDQNGKFLSPYKFFPSLTKEIFGNAIAKKFSKHDYPINATEQNKPAFVELVSGSCMFFRAKDFIFIGGFNEDFFLYCEEEDISKSVWNYGREVVFIPDAEIFHYGGGSSNGSFEMEAEYYISYNILINEHFSKTGIFLLKTVLFFKLFRRIFKRKDGWRIFKFGLKNFPKASSLRYKVS